jgi:hypothetical protein
MTVLPLLISRDTLLPPDSNSTPAFEELPPVRLFRVPDTAPPFDGELPSESPCGAGYDTLQVPPPSIPPSASHVSEARTGPDGNREVSTVRARGSEGPGDWPRHFARLLTEVLSGCRPAQQIMPWLTQRARFHLRRLGPAFNSGQRLRVLRVLVSQPSATVVEMSVIVGAGNRTRALALRQEQAVIPGRPIRWLCTDIESA